MTSASLYFVFILETIEFLKRRCSYQNIILKCSVMLRPKGLQFKADSLFLGLQILSTYSLNNSSLYLIPTESSDNKIYVPNVIGFII